MGEAVSLRCPTERTTGPLLNHLLQLLTHDEHSQCRSADQSTIRTQVLLNTQQSILCLLPGVFVSQDSVFICPGCNWYAFCTAGVVM